MIFGLHLTVISTVVFKVTQALKGVDGHPSAPFCFLVVSLYGQWGVVMHEEMQIGFVILSLFENDNVFRIKQRIMVKRTILHFDVKSFAQVFSDHSVLAHFAKQTASAVVIGIARTITPIFDDARRLH